MPISPIRVTDPLHEDLDDPLAPDTADHRAEAIRPETAARLRALCRELGEPFDAELTEAMARERIAALEARKAAD